MTSIDNALIQTTFKECVTHARRVYGATPWHVLPQSVAVSDAIKSKYATVSPKGSILINRAFIGTASVDALKQTLFHEIAHCIVGLHHHHDRRFRHVLGIISSDITVSDEDKDAVKDNNGYPLRLVAYTSQGAIDMGGAFRRSKKYLNYVPSDAYYLSVKGVKIQRFAYLPYADDWKSTSA